MSRFKHTILLLAAAALLSGCAAGEPAEPVPVETENAAVTVTFGLRETEGSYSGRMLEDVPHGEGSFTAAEGFTYTGDFSHGTARNGEAEALPLTAEFDGIAYTGLYSGAVYNGLPQGEGSFTGESRLGLSFRYTGTWAQGLLSGQGQAEAEHYTATVNGTEQSGCYTGTLWDGLPQGDGSFSGQGEAAPFTYTGRWMAGAFHGQGCLEYEGDNFYLRAGTFTHGSYTPTPLEALEALGSCEPCFTLTDAQRAFIEQHPTIWEPETDRYEYTRSEFRPLCERNFYPRLLFQQPEKYETSWLRLEGLRYITSKTVTLENGMTFTRLTLSDSSYTLAFQCWLAAELPATPWYLSRMAAYAMPLGLSSYTNALGESVPCAVLLMGDMLI